LLIFLVIKRKVRIPRLWRGWSTVCAKQKLFSGSEAETLDFSPRCLIWIS